VTATPEVPPVLVVSGTGTGVGKTVVTAALAALARDRAGRDRAGRDRAGRDRAGRDRAVAVVKPAQTGTDTDTPDVVTVRRLARVTDTHELSRFPDPLSPEAAARTAGLAPLDMHAAAAYIKRLTAARQQVIVEGAGGLLVRYDPDGTTIADLAAMLDAPVLVVAAAGLGTLNHTALTLEALAARALACAGVVIGSWPAGPGLAERANLTDLSTLAGGALAGILPEGAGLLGPADFLATARAGLSPALGGRYLA
jgi:dethiobiotin synthetase